MKTFILFWNPTISNEKGEGRAEFISALKHDDALYSADWAVWDWKEAHKGDRFYKVMVGNPDPKKNGIVESGFFTSDPYIGEDWSGRGREIHYCDLKYDAMIDFDFIVPLSVEALTKEISSFDWSGGHSGRLLDDEYAADLDVMWCEHLIDAQEKDFDIAEAHIYLCNRLDDRLVTWYDDDEEEYGPEEEIDYTLNTNTFRVTGLKDVDVNAILADAAKAIAPENSDCVLVGMIHDCEDKSILETVTLYLKGLSAQGITLTRYKRGYAVLKLDWMASAEEINFVYQFLLLVKKQLHKSRIEIVHDDEAYEIIVNEELLHELKSERLNSMMGMLVDNAHRIFEINGIRHPFYVSPEELNRFKPGSSLRDRAAFVLDEFRTIQWAYEDYDVVNPCNIKAPTGEEYEASILTNSGKVFVSYAERLCLMTSKKQVKIVPFFDFVSAVSNSSYFHSVDLLQFTLAKMPAKEWNTLVENMDGVMLQ